MGCGAQQVIQRDHAAAMELKDRGLQALGAPVLQISLDGLDVALVVLHVAVRGLCVVRHCSTECFLAIVRASALTFQEAGEERQNIRSRRGRISSLSRVEESIVPCLFQPR